MKKHQTLTPEQRENFRSRLVPCPHGCKIPGTRKRLRIRARGLHMHILLVHKLDELINKNATIKDLKRLEERPSAFLTS